MTPLSCARRLRAAELCWPGLRARASRQRHRGAPGDCDRPGGHPREVTGTPENCPSSYREQAPGAALAPSVSGDMSRGVSRLWTRLSRAPPPVPPTPSPETTGLSTSTCLTPAPPGSARRKAGRGTRPGDERPAVPRAAGVRAVQGVAEERGPAAAPRPARGLATRRATKEPAAWSQHEHGPARGLATRRATKEPAAWSQHEHGPTRGATKERRAWRASHTCRGGHGP